MYCHQLHGFKTCLLERDFHTFLSNVLFLSPIGVRSHNSPPLGIQRPRDTPLNVWL